MGVGMKHRLQNRLRVSATTTWDAAAKAARQAPNMPLMVAQMLRLGASTGPAGVPDGAACGVPGVGLGAGGAGAAPAATSDFFTTSGVISLNRLILASV